MNPYQKLVQANKDYHEAVDEILCDDETVTDVELRAKVKTKFGSEVNAVFGRMEIVNATIA